LKTFVIIDFLNKRDPLVKGSNYRESIFRNRKQKGNIMCTNPLEIPEVNKILIGFAYTYIERK